MRLLGNLIWPVFGGLSMGLGWSLSDILAALTIVGIPFAVQHMKLADLSLTPYGKIIFTARIV